MRQEREVVRRINGRDKEHVLFQLLAEELKVRGPTMSAK